MLAINDAGWLSGANVITAPCKHYSDLLGKKPEGIVWHYTNTAHGTAATMARSLQNKAKAQSSYHLAIESDGTIYQSVSFLKGAWHAGSTTAQKFKRADGVLVKSNVGVSANRFAVGIEFVNAGRVKNVDGVWRGWPYTSKGPAAREVITVGKNTWHAFTAAQIKAGHDLLELLVKHYNMTENTKLTHAELDPTRREDPGPLWVQHLNELERCA